MNIKMGASKLNKHYVEVHKSIWFRIVRFITPKLFQRAIAYNALIRYHVYLSAETKLKGVVDERDLEIHFESVVEQLELDKCQK